MIGMQTNMSYPDEWNHIFQDVEAELTATRKNRGENNMNIIRSRIEALKNLKDEAIKQADYFLAAKIRDKIDAAKQRLEEEKKMWTAAPCRNDVPLTGIKKLFLTEFCTSIGSRTVVEKAQINALSEIANNTDHNAPGIYEPKMIEKINSLARGALGLPIAPASYWDHKPQASVSRPRPSTLDFVSLSAMRTCIKKALKELSGDLNHNNVAQAKEILKSLVD